MGDVRRKIRVHHPALLLTFFLSLPLAGCYLGPRPSATALLVAEAPDATIQLLLEAARADQKNFEVYRRSTLPLAIPILSGSFTCTEQVGLYCLDRVIGGLGRIRPTSEDSTVVAARHELIETLQLVNRRIPSDGWVQGQLVRYLVESGNLASAAAATSACRADPAWWCFALAGYVYHRSGYPGPATEAFAVALSGMPPEERAHWIDIAPILDPETAAEYVLLEEGGAVNFEDRFWRLADPLLTRPGNELLNEHLARHVELAFQLDSEAVEGPLRDRNALETIGRYDLLIRYGMPARWLRGLGMLGRVQVYSVAESPYCIGHCGALNWVFGVRGGEGGELVYLRGVFEARSPSGVGAGTGVLAPPRGVRDLIAYYDVPPQDLFPPPALLRAEIGLERPDGESDEEDALAWDVVREVPHTAHALAMEGGGARWIAPLAHQVAVFPRGDSAIVVAGWDLTAHGIADSVQADAGVAFLPMADVLAPVLSEAADRASPAGAVMLKVPARPSLVSIEAAVPEERVMARARFYLPMTPPPPLRPGISDLLLLHGSQEEVRALDEALPLARGANRVAPGEQLGVYWEIYGLDPATVPEVTMSLSLNRPPSGVIGGALRWLGRAVGLLDDDAPILTEWVEEVEAAPWMGRSLTVTVPELSEGTYTLVITANVPGREPMGAIREVEVTRSIIGTPRPGTLVRRPELNRPTRCVPELAIQASAFSVVDPAGYLRTPRCAYTPDPSWFGHYGGADHLEEYGYDGW